MCLLKRPQVKFSRARLQKSARKNQPVHDVSGIFLFIRVRFLDFDYFGMVNPSPHEKFSFSSLVNEFGDNSLNVSEMTVFVL